MCLGGVREASGRKDEKLSRLSGRVKCPMEWGQREQKARGVKAQLYLRMDTGVSLEIKVSGREWWAPRQLESLYISLFMYPVS